MQPFEPPRNDTALCPICRARLTAALPFCPVCGAQLNEAIAREEEELRGVLYLLSELERWESTGQLSDAQAAQLRANYERRRDDLRRMIATRRDERLRPPATEGQRPITQAGATQAEATHAEQPRVNVTSTSEPLRPQDDENHRVRESEFVAFPTRRPAPAPQPPPFQERPQRTLLERLADPQTLRLLLYTGAGMLVVGIVIWLRDLLYLKLQEPAVQAGLLIFGTIVLIAAGWYTILRTRQRWTGRALTFAGSLLVPVNFWFLVRSGLVENQGRGWVVGLFCALLYASTAAALRERLYIYLSCVASVAALWALILRDAPRAFGLYSLALMTASLAFIHISHLLPVKKENADESERDEESESFRGVMKAERWSRELWGSPLARTSLVFAALGALIYMPLRFSTQATSFYDGIFRLRSSSYDASIALLLLAAFAYVLWFAGRFVYERWSAIFYTASALVFFAVVWAACDGLRLSAQATVLTLALVTFSVALVARKAPSVALSKPLHRASLFVSILLAVASLSVALDASSATVTNSAGLALVALTFVALCTPRFTSGAVQAMLSYFAAIYFSASYFIGVGSASIKSETINTLLWSLWPLLLFIAAQLTVRLKRETQLAAPLTRVADIFGLLALLWASLMTLLIHMMSSASPAPSIVSLSAITLYGALRVRLSRSVYGAALGSLSAVVLAATVLDAMQRNNAWPKTWPVAAGTIVFAFILERAWAWWLSRSTDEAGKAAGQSQLKAVRMVLDASVVVCATLWFIQAFALMYEVGMGAPSVLLFALLYWVERVAVARTPWPARITCAHMAAFLITLQIALRADIEWLTLLCTLTLFPVFFILSRTTRAPSWLRKPLSEAAVATLALSLVITLVQASPYLQKGDAHLLAPSLTTTAIALLSLTASLFLRGRASVLYFRAGLWVSVVALMLASLRAGFDPIEDLEIYTTPIAVLILIIAYLSLRRTWQEYDPDVGVLLWIGSLLLCLPLLARSLEFRLLLDSAAPWRDVAVLAASLALILYGVIGRMRAPVLIGSATLIIELSVLTLTSVNWLQVPLKYYLITVGALLLIIFGTLEYRREQFLRVRKRFQERRDRMRQQFGEWR